MYSARCSTHQYSEALSKIAEVMLMLGLCPNYRFGQELEENCMYINTVVYILVTVILEHCVLLELYTQTVHVFM